MTSTNRDLNTRRQLRLGVFLLLFVLGRSINGSPSTYLRKKKLEDIFSSSEFGRETQKSTGSQEAVMNSRKMDRKMQKEKKRHIFTLVVDGLEEEFTLETSLGTRVLEETDTTRKAVYSLTAYPTLSPSLVSDPTNSARYYPEVKDPYYPPPEPYYPPPEPQIPQTTPPTTPPTAPLTIPPTNPPALSPITSLPSAGLIISIIPTDSKTTESPSNITTPTNVPSTNISSTDIPTTAPFVTNTTASTVAPSIEVPTSGSPTSGSPITGPDTTVPTTIPGTTPPPSPPLTPGPTPPPSPPVSPGPMPPPSPPPSPGPTIPPSPPPTPSPTLPPSPGPTPPPSPPPTPPTTTMAPTTSEATVLTLQDTPGVCSGPINGIGCASVDPDTNMAGGNPNDIVNCFDVNEFDITVPFFLDTVRFWIGDSKVAVPPSLGIKVFAGTVADGPMDDVVLYSQEITTGFAAGENSADLDMDLMIFQDQFCVGISSTAADGGLRIQTDTTGRMDDASYLKSPACGIEEFRSLSDSGLMDDFCIEALVSKNGSRRRYR